MQRKFFSEPGKKSSTRKNPVNLLPRTIDVGRAREHYGKLISFKKSHKMHVASRTGSGIGRAGVKRGILFYDPRTASVNFRGGHMEIFLSAVPFPQLFMKPDVGHNVGLVPMNRV